MSAAKQAWLDSRDPYLQTEVYRVYDGPIDTPDDGPEGLLNAWPLDEQYIDYVVGDDDAGIINGDDTIDAATLEGLNEVGGEKNVATGYHAVEFLLWGQDLSETGPGERSYTDYVRDGSGTAANQDRRGTYLNVVGTMLVEHLSGVHV
jgi:putative iron-regulated protein